MDYYSQCGEDRWLLEHFPELATRKGIFVEVGAYDGIESSNTLAFERLGWTGTCFECSPELYRKLYANRRHCSLLALDRFNGLATFHTGGDLQGQHSLIAYDHNQGREIVVEVSRLEDAIDYPHIDLLSLDTEGSELDVWAGRGRYSPEFVICEFDTFGTINPHVDKLDDRAIADRRIKEMNAEEISPEKWTPIMELAAEIFGKNRSFLTGMQ